VPPVGVDIEAYDWDLDGNGTFEILDSDAAAKMPIYLYEGVYWPRCRVNMSNGLVSVAWGALFAGTDEAASDDTPATARTLLANIPSDFIYKGFDDVDPYKVLVGHCDSSSDIVDYATFNISAESLGGVHVRLVHDSTDLNIYLEDSEGDVLAFDSGAGHEMQIDYNIQPADVAPYYVRVEAGSGSGNYELRLITADPVM
jgi:hypothetical protein